MYSDAMSKRYNSSSKNFFLMLFYVRLISIFSNLFVKSFLNSNQTDKNIFWSKIRSLSRVFLWVLVSLEQTGPHLHLSFYIFDGGLFGIVHEFRLNHSRQSLPDSQVSLSTIIVFSPESWRIFS